MSSAVAALKAGKPAIIDVADVMCPVCLSVFVEPVGLPCSHVLCMPCFRLTLDKTSLSCPICRERLGSWSRRATKQGTLVQQQLWQFVQENFAAKVAARMAGLENDSEELVVPSHKIADTGEVGAEFSAEVSRLQQEAAKEQVEEEKRSLELARRLLAEERQEQEDEERKEQSEKLERRRSRHKPVSNSPSLQGPNLAKKGLQVHNETSPFTKPDTRTGPTSRPGSRCPSTESNNSIDSEMTHFRPIRVAPLSPPKKLPDGSLLRPSIVLTTPNRRLSFRTRRKMTPAQHQTPLPPSSSSSSPSSLHCSESLGLSSPASCRVSSLPSTSSRASSEAESRLASTPSTPSLSEEADVPECGDTQTLAYLPGCVDTQTLTDLLYREGVNLDPRVVQEQREVENRLEQEKMDQELAERLQEEMERERRAPPDRRKGSVDSYPLRQTPTRKFSRKRSLETDEVAEGDEEEDEESRTKRCKTEKVKSLNQSLMTKFLNSPLSLAQ